MKAIVLVKEGDSKEAFEMQERETPTPKPHEVLVKVSHFGLNYADVMSRLGRYNDRPPMPIVLGYEAVGTIESCGDQVDNVKVGERVLAFTKFGAYAEYAVADARGVIKLNENTTSEEATALATQYGTAWVSSMFMIRLTKGDRVLIHAAAGGVGTALVQIAKWKGCEVFGTAGSEKKMEYLRSLGVDHPINYREVNFEEEILKILGKKRLDVVFDPVGSKTFRRSFNLLGSGGRIVSFGASDWSSTKGSFMDKLRLLFGFGFLHPIFLLMKSKAVIGVNMLRLGENRPEYVEACMNEVFEHYEKGILKPTIDSVYSANDIAEAHDRLGGRGSIGKVVVKWD